MTRFGWVLAAVLATAIAGCGDDDEAGGGAASGAGTREPAGGAGTKQPAAGAGGGAAAASAEVPASLPNGLLLAYAQFEVEDGRVTARPGPARLEILTREGGEWRTQVIEDRESAVFHKAMLLEPASGAPGILTLAGTTPVAAGQRSQAAAKVELWRNTPEGWRAQTLWQSTFGGRINRMRDAEIADVYGDQRPDVAVGTHDQGVVAVLRQQETGNWTAVEIDREADTFVHEIEIGDVNGDGVLEVYATPSEPNTLDGQEQHGEVVRYVPKNEEGRQVVADLGNRHAKEILVADVDGDGRDELYVAVEALTRGEGGAEIVEPVQIRRYDANTPPDQGVVIATIEDRLTRFLTYGDVDHDGKNELVAAAFRSGLWLLEPGSDPRGEWSIESIDRDSSGFEHAAVVADLDGDGTSELYVAADEQGEVRRYVWVNGRPRRETIHRREHPRSMLTFGIVAVPVSVLSPRSE